MNLSNAGKPVVESLLLKEDHPDSVFPAGG